METEFEKQQALFWQQVGEHGCMVLSTSLHDEVTSRMMSFLLLEGELWFQTDRRVQKYRQKAADAPGESPGIPVPGQHDHPGPLPGGGTPL